MHIEQAAGFVVFRVTTAHLDDGATLPLILQAIREREGGRPEGAKA
jgi:hypothetical protein